MNRKDTNTYFKKAHGATHDALKMIEKLREMFDDLPEDVRIHMANKISTEAHEMRVHARAMHTKKEGLFYSEEDFGRLVNINNTW